MGGFAVRKAEKLHVKRRVVRDLALAALALALLFGLTGASPTPGLALRRTLAGAHFGPYEVEAAFSVPSLDCFGQDTHYYLTRCRDWSYLAAVERVDGVLWRQEHPVLIGPLPEPLYCTLIDFAPHARCRPRSHGPSYSSLDILEPGTTSAWLVRCTDPAVVRVEADERRTSGDGRSDSAAVEARNVGEGVWVLEFRRPAPERDDALDFPTLALSEVRCYGADGQVLYTQAEIGGVTTVYAPGLLPSP